MKSARNLDDIIRAVTMKSRFIACATDICVIQISWDRNESFGVDLVNNLYLDDNK